MVIAIITPFYKGNKYIKKLSEYIKRNVDEVEVENKKEEDPEKKVHIKWVLVNDSPEIPIDRKQIVDGIDYEVIDNEKNVGIHAARVKGYKNSESDYVVFLDQDDEISALYMISQLKHLGDGDAVVCNGYYESAEHKNNKIIVQTIEQYKYLSDLESVNNLEVYLKYKNPIRSPGQCLISRKVIPYVWLNSDIEINGSDDLLMWILMLKTGVQFKINRETMFWHNSTGVNVSDNAKTIENSSMNVLEILTESGLLDDKERDELRRSIIYAGKDKHSISDYLHNKDLVNERIKWRLRRITAERI